MSFRSSMVIVVVVSFSLTLGIGLWQRKRAEPTPTPDVQATAYVQPTADVPPITPKPAPASSKAPRPMVVDPPAESPSPQDGSEMPLQLGFNHRAKDHKLVAKVFSSASYPLVVGVKIASPSGGAVDGQITVPPNGEVTFGGEDSLHLESGDNVTLLSHPYADKVAQAP